MAWSARNEISYLKGTSNPVVSKKLPNDRDHRFLPRYDHSIAHLAVHGTFLESVLDTGSMFVAYYNTSDADIFLPANTRIGEPSE